MRRGTAMVLERERERVIPPDRSIIVTIDGPAGTGKSSVAHALANRLGVDVLDTGAMYRAAAAIVIDHDLTRNDVQAIVDKVTAADLHFDWSTDPPAMLAWDKPMNARLRDEDVTALVSEVSAIGPLREHMVRKQRIIASQHPRLVSEGRDQGSVVFPDADVKFYLDAAPQVRAVRRVEQLREAGQHIELDEMLRQINKRDTLDSTRTDGPLVCPADAIRIDTSRMSFDQVVERLAHDVLEHVREPS